MAGAYSKYSEEFKEMVLKQVASGRKAADVARQYNITAPNIRYWIKKAKEKEKNLDSITKNMH